MIMELKVTEKILAHGFNMRIFCVITWIDYPNHVLVWIFLLFFRAVSVFSIFNF